MRRPRAAAALASAACALIFAALLASCVPLVQALDASKHPAVQTVPVLGDVDQLGYVYVAAGFFIATPDDPDHRGLSMRLALDSSSRLTSAPCAGCVASDCGVRRAARVVNRDHQTTPVLCMDSACPPRADAGADRCARQFVGASDQCVLEAAFTEGQFLEGVFTHSTVNVSSFSSRVLLGCVLRMSDGFRTQLADGVLGLAPSSDFLGVGTNGQSSGWTLCLASGGFYGGELTLGSAVPFGPDVEDFPWVEVTRSRAKTGESNQWKEVYVAQLGSQQLSIGDLAVSAPGVEALQASVNTGSALTWLPQALFEPARKALFTFCDGEGRCGGNVRVTGDPGALACFDLREPLKALHLRAGEELFKQVRTREGDSPNKFLAREVFETFPNVTFRFALDADAGQKHMQKHMEVQASAREYMYRSSKLGVYCIGLMMDKEGAAKAKGSETAPAVSIGVNVMRGHKWEFKMSGREQSTMRVSPCASKFELTLLQDADRNGDGIGSEGAGRGGVDAFVGTFALFAGMLATLCMMWMCRCVCGCGRASVRYDRLDEFGEGGHANGNGIGNGARTGTVEMAKFSIGSEDEDVGLSDYEHDSDEQDEFMIGDSSNDGRGGGGGAKNGKAGYEDVDALVRSAQDVLDDSDSDSE